jgi:hypothetical protein
MLSVIETSQKPYTRHTPRAMTMPDQLPALLVAALFFAGWSFVYWSI